MRQRLLLALLLLGSVAARAADAYEIRYRVSYGRNHAESAAGGTGASATVFLAPGDTVHVDVWLDAEPGLQALFVDLAWWPFDTLEYRPEQATAPAYILYTPIEGMPPPGFAKWVEPVNFPWPERPPLETYDDLPGVDQAWYSNYRFREPAPASGENIRLTSVVFEAVDYTLYQPSFVVRASADANRESLDRDDIPITEVVPEPGATVLTVAAAAVVLGLPRLRRSRRTR